MGGNTKVVLILEYEPLICIDLEMTFVTAGFEVFSFASCVKAERWLNGQHPDILILDIKLLDGPSDAVASRVSAAQIPFIVHSGEHITSHENDIYAHGAWLGKPAPADLLVALATDLLTKRDQEQNRQIRQHNYRHQDAWREHIDAKLSTVMKVQSLRRARH